MSRAGIHHIEEKGNSYPLRALAKTPADRFPTVRAWRVALMRPSAPSELGSARVAAGFVLRDGRQPGGIVRLPLLGLVASRSHPWLATVHFLQLGQGWRAAAAVHHGDSLAQAVPSGAVGTSPPFPLSRRERGDE